MVRLLFGRQWWWTTLIVVVAIGVMIRLGIWQLDRLEQRRAFNARVSAQLTQPVLALRGTALGADLTHMEYRSVVVVGVYDFSQEVALRNQVHENRLGVHLLTPLVISGTSEMVLVDRGWIPVEDATSEGRRRYDEPGVVKVQGVIRASQSEPDFGGVPDPTTGPSERLLTWNLVNVDRIRRQVVGSMLPIYIQQGVDPAHTGLPVRSQPELDLSEGSHFGYAMQWFVFALVLGVGYPRYVWQQARQRVAV